MECPSQPPPGVFDFSAPHDPNAILLVVILAGFLVAGVAGAVFLSLKLHRAVPEGPLFQQFYLAQGLGLLGSLILLIGLLWLGTLTSGYPLIPGAFALLDAVGCVGGSTQAAYLQMEQVLMVLAGVDAIFLLACAVLLPYSTIRLGKLARAVETP